jgi:DMSO/TMAO reductase YedYZ molybdopterin-dependent catalytic subunit
MPVTEVTWVMQCAGNGRGLYAPTVPGVQWRYGALGNARWRGVRDVLDRAGVKSTAKYLHTFGSDDPPKSVPPFHRSIEMGKARAAIETSCDPCHSADILVQQRLTEKQWTANIDKMIRWGAVVPDKDRAEMIAYLTRNFGPDNNRFKPLRTRPVGY